MCSQTSAKTVKHTSTNTHTHLSQTQPKCKWNVWNMMCTNINYVIYEHMTIIESFIQIIWSPILCEWTEKPKTFRRLAIFELCASRAYRADDVEKWGYFGYILSNRVASIRDAAIGTIFGVVLRLRYAAGTIFCGDYFVFELRCGS